MTYRTNMDWRGLSGVIKLAQTKGLKFSDITDSKDIDLLIQIRCSLTCAIFGIHHTVVQGFDNKYVIVSWEYKSWDSWNKAFHASFPYPMADVATPPTNDHDYDTYEVVLSLINLGRFLVTVPFNLELPVDWLDKRPPADITLSRGRLSQTKCHFCRASGSTSRILQSCGRCKNVRYCSSECQKSDWHLHKQNCRSIEEKT